MTTLILNQIQMSKIDDSTDIKSPTNDNYVKETEKNNKILKEKIYEYTEAYKNAAKFYVR